MLCCCQLVQAFDKRATKGAAKEWALTLWTLRSMPYSSNALADVSDSTDLSDPALISSSPHPRSTMQMQMGGGGGNRQSIAGIGLTSGLPVFSTSPRYPLAAVHEVLSSSASGRGGTTLAAHLQQQEGLRGSQECRWTAFSQDVNAVSSADGVCSVVWLTGDRFVVGVPNKHLRVIKVSRLQLDAHSSSSNTRAIFHLSL